MKDSSLLTCWWHAGADYDPRVMSAMGLMLNKGKDLLLEVVVVVHWRIQALGFNRGISTTGADRAIPSTIDLHTMPFHESIRQLCQDLPSAT